MIPKVIHYCWFGRNEKTKEVLKCIESWKRFCPGYEIVEWNEDNFNIECIDFVKEAYKAGKWAFVTDYARLKIVYENGGIYLDTDVELLRNLDDLLSLSGFAGFQDDNCVATGLGFGAEKGQRMICEMMIDYHNRHFTVEGNEYEKLACPILNTDVLKRFGLLQNGEMQTVEGITVFPSEYFAPMDSQTYITTVTGNTYSIHHYDASWKNKYQKMKKTVIRTTARIIGKKNLMKLKSKLK